MVCGTAFAPQKKALSFFFLSFFFLFLSFDLRNTHTKKKNKKKQ